MKNCSNGIDEYAELGNPHLRQCDSLLVPIALGPVRCCEDWTCTSMQNGGNHEIVSLPCTLCIYMYVSFGGKIDAVEKGGGGTTTFAQK